MSVQTLITQGVQGHGCCCSIGYPWRHWPPDRRSLHNRSGVAMAPCMAFFEVDMAKSGAGLTTTPRQLQSLYDQGVNISAHLRQEQGLTHNTREIVEVAYDLQTGSYVEAMANPDTAASSSASTNARFDAWCRIFAGRIPSSRRGVGEGTTLSGVLQHLPGSVRSFGIRSELVPGGLRPAMAGKPGSGRHHLVHRRPVQHPLCRQCRGCGLHVSRRGTQWRWRRSHFAGTLPGGAALPGSAGARL